MTVLQVRHLATDEEVRILSEQAHALTRSLDASGKPYQRVVVLEDETFIVKRDRFRKTVIPVGGLYLYAMMEDALADATYGYPVRYTTSVEAVFKLEAKGSGAARTHTAKLVERRFWTEAQRTKSARFDRRWKDSRSGGHADKVGATVQYRGAHDARLGSGPSMGKIDEASGMEQAPLHPHDVNNGMHRGPILPYGTHRPNNEIRLNGELTTLSLPSPSGGVGSLISVGVAMLPVEDEADAVLAPHTTSIAVYTKREASDTLYKPRYIYGLVHPPEGEARTVLIAEADNTRDWLDRNSGIFGSLEARGTSHSPDGKKALVVYTDKSRKHLYDESSEPLEALYPLYVKEVNFETMTVTDADFARADTEETRYSEPSGTHTVYDGESSSASWGGTEGYRLFGVHSYSDCGRVGYGADNEIHSLIVTEERTYDATQSGSLSTVTVRADSIMDTTGSSSSSFSSASRIVYELRYDGRTMRSWTLQGSGNTSASADSFLSSGIGSYTGHYSYSGERSGESATLHFDTLFVDFVKQLAFIVVSKLRTTHSLNMTINAADPWSADKSTSIDDSSIVEFTTLLVIYKGHVVQEIDLAEREVPTASGNVTSEENEHVQGQPWIEAGSAFGEWEWDDYPHSKKLVAKSDRINPSADHYTGESVARNIAATPSRKNIFVSKFSNFYSPHLAAPSGCLWIHFTGTKTVLLDNVEEVVPQYEVAIFGSTAGEGDERSLTAYSSVYDLPTDENGLFVPFLTNANRSDESSIEWRIEETP